jgi:hypothetical protein
MIAPADKGTTLVIIQNDDFNNNINSFLTNNNFNTLERDRSDKYNKEIQSIIQNHNILIDKQKAKYLTQLNPTSPILKARLKIHKNDIPIRTVVNNINAPSYKLAKYIHDKLREMINLPNTNNCTNSIDLGHELIQLTATGNYRMLTLDKRYLRKHTDDIPRTIRTLLQYRENLTIPNYPDN